MCTLYMPLNDALYNRQDIFHLNAQFKQYTCDLVHSYNYYDVGGHYPPISSYIHHIKELPPF